MAKLIYASNMSLDGCTEDERGALDWAPPDDDVFAFITDLMRSAGTYLYGRRMYETMAVWETDAALAEQSDLRRDFANVWQAADKVVYSTTLAAVSTANTRLERHFDPGAVQRPEGRGRTAISSWEARTSRHRRSRPGWSTSAACSSGPSSSVGASRRCRPTCAPSSSSSTSADSATASSTSATALGRNYGTPARRMAASSVGHGGPSWSAPSRACAARRPFGSWSSGSKRHAATMARTRPRHASISC